MNPPLPDPTPITRHLDGAFLHAIVVAAMELRVCGHLAQGPATAEQLAERAGVPLRGAQALLDALVGLGLVIVEEGRYRNGAAADCYLVPGREMYLGDESIGLFHAQLPLFDRMAEQVRAGVPVHDDASAERLRFWSLLVPSIGRIGRPVAERAVRLLGLDQGEPHLLDVGGGAAPYGLALLGANRRARVTQLDLAPINERARHLVRERGGGARFHTIDGDYRATPLGEGRYDVAVLSYVVHLEPPEEALALLRRVYRALKPRGRVLVAEFVVDDGRAGPPGPLLFHLNMLLHSRGGRSYERGELARLLEEAGFRDVRFEAAEAMTTLVIGERDDAGEK